MTRNVYAYKKNDNYGSTTCMHLSFISFEISMGIIKYDLYVNNFIFIFYQFGTQQVHLLI